MSGLNLIIILTNVLNINNTFWDICKLKTTLVKCYLA